ncbi:MAG: glutathione peroxidase [Octadecabacter sp.]|nr:glutathione peroxidase [Octadecabacter sp.]
MIRAFAIFTAACLATQAASLDLDTPFGSIDGGTLSFAQWDGQPVLVVNTASMCAFSGQYRDLQDLYDRYRDQGLVVLAIPSDDFKQELATNAEVKSFCELQYGIDIPMTEITHVKGANAHPFYQSLDEEIGFTPRWNFNKVLIDQSGDVVETYGSQVSPMSPVITRQIEALFE